mgnify:CR=1 FL=1
MRKLILLFLIVIVCSCGNKIYNKKELIDFKSNTIPAASLRLDGYYYNEFETDNNYRNYRYMDSVKIKTIRYFFIYEDGFALNLITTGVDPYYCVQNIVIENSFENAHNNILQKVEAQNSSIKKVKNTCDFNPNDVTGKGIVKINQDTGKITVQYYVMEYKDHNVAISSYYLYEMTGDIINDTTFKINTLKSYKDNKVEDVNFVYRFRESNKPVVPNYFKEHMRGI